MFEFMVDIVAKVSPNWTKKAERIAISSGDLPCDMLHAKTEINVTSSQFCKIITSLKIFYARLIILLILLKE